MSFRRETSGGVAKCRLFSQAIQSRKSLGVCAQKNSTFSWKVERTVSTWPFSCMHHVYVKRQREFVERDPVSPFFVVY